MRWLIGAALALAVSVPASGSAQQQTAAELGNARGGPANAKAHAIAGRLMSPF